LGFLTVAMLTQMLHDACTDPLDGDADTEGSPVISGFDKLRLIEAVHVGERIRGHFTRRAANHID
jgi:acyl dehydratase